MVILMRTLISCGFVCSGNRLISVDAFVFGTITAASTGIVTFLAKQRQLDRLRNELQLLRYRAQEMETQTSRMKELEENLKISSDELSRKIAESMELRSSYEKLDSLLKFETSQKWKREEDFTKAIEKIQSLESSLGHLNSKYMEETRQLSECKGRLESAQAATQMTRDEAERETKARTTLEKTIETSLKINIERIREDLVNKTREVVGAGVVETLKSSLRQTPVLGRFGEIQLDYLLKEYFTLGQRKLYDEQITLESRKRLDAVLKLPIDDGILHIIVDAKTPNIFQPNGNSCDPAVTVNQLRSRLTEVLTTLRKANYVEYYRQHLASRSTKDGKEITDHVFDFVLMFLPMDYALLAVDEKLLKKCVEAKVIICTPSLLGLQTEFIKMAWRQKIPSDAIAHVEEDVTALTNCLETLNKDLEKCGSSLRMATSRANTATNRIKNAVATVFQKMVRN